MRNYWSKKLRVEKVRI